MSFALRTPGEVDAITEAGRIAGAVLDKAFDSLHPGDRARDVAARVEAWLSETAAESALVGFDDGGRCDPFPSVVCVSVDDQMPWTIPGDRVLSVGSVVTLDLAVRLDGWHADVASTRVMERDGAVLAGDPGVLHRELMGFVQRLDPAAGWKPGALTHPLAEAVLSVVPGPLGHGIGRRLHESPALLPDREAPLPPGTVVAVEPVACRGVWSGEAVGRGGWSGVPRNGRAVVAEERTVAITADGPRVLTPLACDKEYEV